MMRNPEQTTIIGHVKVMRHRGPDSRESLSNITASSSAALHSAEEGGTQPSDNPAAVPSPTTNSYSKFSPVIMQQPPSRFRNIVLVTSVLVVLIFYFRTEGDAQYSAFKTASNVAVIKPKLPPCHGTSGLLGPFIGSCSPAVQRLLDYCSVEIPSGAEGILPAGSSSQMELKHVLVTIRHGDRSAIHKMPGSTPATSTASDISASYLDPNALLYVNRMSGFHLEPLKDTSKVMDSLDRSSTKLFKINDTSLDQGQLTSRGFMQHIALGGILRKAYGKFMSTITSPSELIVRSTNYDRTVQSVAAFLTALLPDVIAAAALSSSSSSGSSSSGSSSSSSSSGNSSAGLKIRYFPSEKDEFMHGIGLRHSSHVVDEKKGEASFAGGCDRSVALAKTERESFVPAVDAMAALVDIFGPDVRDRFITDLVDATLPPVCHNRPLPCADKEGTKCMGVDLAGHLMAEADRAFCARYTGDHGGKTATLLATYPFMQEIVNTLTAAATAAQTPERVKLSIFSGHDTVVAPVLAALSVYADAELCRWPPYASRVAFELWQSTKSTKSSPSDVMCESFIRVIFNGVDVTERIPSCASEGRGVCSLGAFSQQVKSLLGGHGTMKDACKVPQ